MADITDTTGSNIRVSIIEEPLEKRLAYASGQTSLHAKILSRLIARRRLSERSMSNRYDAWNRVDENCRLFIDLSRSAKKGDGTTDTTKKEIPWARSIVVPMSYAILQVYNTQLMGIYTRRNPPIEIQGVGPEDIRPAKLMNAVIAYDQVQTNYILELYTAIQDALKYGMGGFHDCWEEEYGWVTKRKPPIISQIFKMLGISATSTEWDVRRQYQLVEAFDPFNTFPDPRISLSNVQKAEFYALRVYRGYLDLLAHSQENGGNYFNVEAIPKTAPKPQSLRSRNRFQNSQMNLIGSIDEKDKGFHALDSMVITLIPDEWELGYGTKPEKWQFAWVDDTVIIRAHKLDYDHQQFNFSVLESNIDTHVFGNQGSIENMDGLQRFMNWEMNSIIQNHIRFINNRLVYSAAFIESFDIEHPDAAMHIRLTAQGEEMLREGRMTIPQMIHQLQLVDVMSPLIRDLQMQMDFMMRMSGAADQMMAQTTHDKRTLGEISRVGHEGSARMMMHAMMMDIQGIRPLALRWVANRQQYTDQDMFVRVAGSVATEFGGDRTKVRPQDIYGNYDYIPKTGPEGPDPKEMTEIMFNGLATIMKSGVQNVPDENGRVFDPHKYVKDTLRQSGITNIDDYYRSLGGLPGQTPPGTNVVVKPDEEVARMAEAGNAVPVDSTRGPMMGVR